MMLLENIKKIFKIKSQLKKLFPDYYKDFVMEHDYGDITFFPIQVVNFYIKESKANKYIYSNEFIQHFSRRDGHLRFLCQILIDNILANINFDAGRIIKTIYQDYDLENIMYYYYDDNDPTKFEFLKEFNYSNLNGKALEKFISFVSENKNNFINFESTMPDIVKDYLLFGV